MDNALRAVLTEACEIAQDNHPGFKWLTHFADYSRFPASLSVVCVYDTNANLSNADIDGMRALVKEKLQTIDVNIKDITHHVSFDTEERCGDENSGKWLERSR